MNKEYQYKELRRNRKLLRDICRKVLYMSYEEVKESMVYDMERYEYRIT